MTSGPAPKPTAFKLAAGNPGRRPLPADEPKFEPATLEPPEELEANARASKEWQKLAPMLQKAGVLMKTDKNTMAQYCIAYSGFIEAARGIAKEGYIQINTDGLMALNPHIKAYKLYSEEVRRLAGELGLTPSSRTRIHATPPKDPEKDDFFEQ